MSNLFIAKPDLSDAAIVSAHSAVSGMPVANLQDAELSKRTRTSSLSSTFWVVTFAASTVFDMVALLATNIDDGGKWQIRTANTVANLTAAPLHDSGVITFWPQTGLSAFASTSEVNGLYKVSSPVTSLYCRVDVSNAANPDGYIEAGRLFISEVFQPTYNPDFGQLSFGYKSQPRSAKSPGGTTFVDEPWRLRQADFLTAWMSQAEAMGQSLELDRLKGTSGNLLLVLDPDESTYLHDMIIYGHLLRLTPLRFTGPGYFEKPWSFEELK